MVNLPSLFMGATATCVEPFVEPGQIGAPQVVKAIGIDFPEILVVGHESTGKSSVLERLTVRRHLQ